MFLIIFELKKYNNYFMIFKLYFFCLYSEKKFNDFKKKQNN